MNLLNFRNSIWYHMANILIKYLYWLESTKAIRYSLKFREKQSINPRLWVLCNGVNNYCQPNIFIPIFKKVTCYPATPLISSFHHVPLCLHLDLQPSFTGCVNSSCWEDILQTKYREGCRSRWSITSCSEVWSGRVSSCVLLDI